MENAYRSGRIKTQQDREDFINTRNAHYRQWDNAERKGGKLTVIEFISVIVKNPLGLIDFVVFHPIKIIKALLQAAFVALIIFLLIHFSNGGTIAEIVDIIQRLTE